MKDHKQEKQRHPIRTIILGLLVVLVLFILCYYLLNSAFNEHNPHILFISGENAESIDSIKRVDKDGRLYKMIYSGDYSAPSSKNLISIIKLFSKAGCTAFYSKDENGNYITCRNFDFPHLDRDGNTTGITVAIECALEDGYRSLAFADATIVNETKILNFSCGQLDNGKSDLSLMAFLPWICMDGINEKGLTVSILYLDIKDGEKATHQNDTGKECILTTQLLRLMLDYCSNTDEAVELASEYNIYNTLGTDYHLFVTDSSGNYVLIEWRNQEMVVVPTNAATNFYQCSDDAADCYQEGELKEKWNGPAETQTQYHYGYGHGYERFKTVVKALDGKDSISHDYARCILEDTSQKYSGGHDSNTLYGVIYDNTNRTAEIKMPDCDNTFVFPLY